MDNIERMLARLFNVDLPDDNNDDNWHFDRKLKDARDLWAGDDRDAVAARLTLDACEAYAHAIVSSGVSQLLHRALKPVIDASIVAVEELTHLGVVRAVALNRPTPADAEWLTRDDEGEVT